MRNLLHCTIFAMVSFCPAFAYASCNRDSGCGPDQRQPLEMHAFHDFNVPEGTLGRIVFTTEAECEQAIVFYDDGFERIGRLGTHNNDAPGKELREHGLAPGNYHVGGYMKDAGRWRNSTSKVREEDSTRVIVGWDEDDCGGQDPDDDFNDILLAIRFEKVQTNQ